MATESNTDRKPPAEKITVWYQLIISNEKPSRPSSVVVDSTTNIDNLMKTIKTENRNRLNHVDAGELEVYPQGTDPKNLRVKDSIRPGASVPQDTTDESPLIVVVPPKSPTESMHPVSSVFVG